jgi:hypothetical protein
MQDQDIACRDWEEPQRKGGRAEARTEYLPVVTGTLPRLAEAMNHTMILLLFGF